MTTVGAVVAIAAAVAAAFLMYLPGTGRYLCLRLRNVWKERTWLLFAIVSMLVVDGGSRGGCFCGWFCIT